MQVKNRPRIPTPDVTKEVVDRENRLAASVANVQNQMSTGLTLMPHQLPANYTSYTSADVPVVQVGPIKWLKSICFYTEVPGFTYCCFVKLFTMIQMIFESYSYIVKQILHLAFISCLIISLQLSGLGCPVTNPRTGRLRVRKQHLARQSAGHCSTGTSRPLTRSRASPSYPCKRTDDSFTTHLAWLVVSPW